ncbi:DUF4825 domain-containing protein [Paenibacillus yanchengensis]|uniref:DUF4825 domain-containing protein n=1 Tax=Paenibacillus yanchengensis TaxID=2035833 RepID=A0ABW4YJ65_9BACL
MRNIIHNKKATIAVISFLTIIIAVGISFLSNPVKSQGAITNDKEKLWLHRTSYMGDNNKVSTLSNTLQYPQPFQYDHIQLQTTNLPYRLTIFLKSDPTVESYGQPQLTDQRTTIQPHFDRAALLLFSLIENVDEISFQLPHLSQEQSLLFKRTDAQQMFDRPLYKMTATKKDFDQFFKKLQTTKQWNIDGKLVGEYLLEANDYDTIPANKSAKLRSSHSTHKGNSIETTVVLNNAEHTDVTIKTPEIFKPYILDFQTSKEKLTPHSTEYTFTITISDKLLAENDLDKAFVEFALVQRFNELEGSIFSSIDEFDRSDFDVISK